MNVAGGRRIILNELLRAIRAITGTQRAARLRAGSRGRRARQPRRPRARAGPCSASSRATSLREGLRRTIESSHSGARRTSHERLRDRHRLRRPRDRRLLRRVRRAGGLRRQGRREDRSARARRDPDLRAGPRRARRAQRARRAASRSPPTRRTRCASALVVFIAVQTPPRDGRQHRSRAPSKRVAREIGRALDGYKVVVTKSTVPVGTRARVQGAGSTRSTCRGPASESLQRRLEPGVPARGLGDRRLHAPRPRRDRRRGRAGARRSCKDLYRPLYLIETPIVLTNVATAELTKYAANASSRRRSRSSTRSRTCARRSAPTCRRSRAASASTAASARSSCTRARATAARASRRTRARPRTSRAQLGELARDRRGGDPRERQRQRERMVEKIVRALGGERRGQDDRRARALVQAQDRRHARRAVARHRRRA